MILWTIFGYLLGSIPFGLVIARALGLGDLRSIGSGNIGATNVLRTGNKPAALATLLLDSGKGAIAVLVARHLGGDTAAMLAGFGAQAATKGSAARAMAGRRVMVFIVLSPFASGCFFVPAGIPI